MYYSFYDTDTTLAMIRSSALEIVRSEVLKNFEDGREVRFLWVLATKA